MQLSNSIRIISILLFLLFYGAKGDYYAKEKYLEIKKEKDAEREDKLIFLGLQAPSERETLIFSERNIRLE